MLSPHGPMISGRIPTSQRIDFLRLKVAPLLRFVPDVDVAAETFTNKVERLALALLTGTASPQQLASIAEDVSRLPQEIRDRPSKSASADLALSPDLAKATPRPTHGDDPGTRAGNEEQAPR